MQEICPSGSEGGAKPTLSLPLSLLAPDSEILLEQELSGHKSLKICERCRLATATLWTRRSVR